MVLRLYIKEVGTNQFMPANSMDQLTCRSRLRPSHAHPIGCCLKVID